METKEKIKIPKTFTTKGKTWSPEIVKEEMLNSDNVLKKALLRIYSFQTEEEKRAEQTYATKGKGFNANDSKILTSFAIQLETQGWLSKKQIEYARKRMVKYSRQIYTYIVESHRTLVAKYGL
jgi:hypothetical protein